MLTRTVCPFYLLRQGFSLDLKFGCLGPGLQGSTCPQSALALGLQTHVLISGFHVSTGNLKPGLDA